MTVPADHQIRATTISGGWDYENCEKESNSGYEY